MARLNLIPTERLSNSYAATVIPLFEREATSLHQEMQGEGYGEYLLHLQRGVVRLRDARSLRGLALLGIQMSREAQEYVASQGARGVPYLDEAWARDSNARDAVVATWSYMLGPYQQALGRPERLQVIARLSSILPSYPRAFTWAAEIAPLPEAVPLVEGIALGAPQLGERRRTDEVLAKLRPLRDQLPPAELMMRVADWLEAFCLDAQGGKRTACQTLVTSVADARGQLQTGGIAAARPALDRIIYKADDAHNARLLTDKEHRFLVGNVQFLRGRS